MIKYTLPYWVTKSKTNEENLILFNWKNNKSVSVFEKNHPAYLLIESDFFSSNSNISDSQSEDLKWLVDHEFLLIADEPILASFKKYEVDLNDLHLILLPAGEACNLDCVYCYEDHSYKKRMDGKSIEALINFVKNKDPNSLSIEYFGGEPMLNLNFIQKFSQELVNNKIRFRASITTNGTLLTEDSLKILYDSNIRYFQITIDGPKDLHNLLRVSKSKNIDSYDSVYHGLKVISESVYQDITCVVRINANETTIKNYNFKRFLQDFVKIIYPGDSRFLILPKPIGDYLGTRCATFEG